MADASSPPFVVVPGIANFRDLGGYPTSSGKTVRNGLIFRAADPSNATQEGLKKMSAELDERFDLSTAHPKPTGIKSIYDLRSESEVKKDPISSSETTDIFSPHDITRHWTPVFATGSWGPEQLSLRCKNYARSGSEGFVAAYRDILTAGTSAFGQVLRSLAVSDPKPVLFHCSAGKDRTGVLGAITLLLLGVEADAVAGEYALTDVGLRELKPGFVQRLLQHPAMEGNREGVENMVSSKKENMLATIEMLNRDFGGAEKYIKEKVGLSDAEVEALKRNLLI